MRIPLAESFPIKYVAAFAFVLFLVQQLEHTNLTYSSLCALYVLLSALAFNAAGGFIYPAGAWIFFNATLVVIVGITYKAMLGEVGQSNLRAPNSTMLMDCGAMLVTGLVGALALRITPKRGLLSAMAFGEPMKKAAVGAFVLGTTVQLASFRLQENGSFLSAIRQINHFNEMAILLATFYQVKKTAGRQSTNWIVWTAGIWSFVFNGLLSFSKQGLLLAGVTWLVAAITAGHDFTRKQLFGILCAAVFFQTFLVPYSQVGRVFRDEDPTTASDARNAIRFLGDLGGAREMYLTSQAELSAGYSEAPHLYDTREGFFDRLNMLSPDDALVEYTDQGNEEGLLPTSEAFLNLIPHFIWKEKPFYYIGNQYAREIGMIAEENESTGVSFSPAADAYHQARWFGIFVVLPVILLILFTVINTLSGDIRLAPWGILFIVIGAHDAPEGMIGGQMYDASYTAFGVIIIALMSKHVLPVVSGIFANSGRSRVLKSIDFRPALRPRPIDPAPPSDPSPKIV